jgi:hypothetical protein
MFDHWSKVATLGAALALLLLGFLPDPAMRLAIGITVGREPSLLTIGDLVKAIDPYRFYLAGILVITAIYFSAFGVAKAEVLRSDAHKEQIAALEERLRPRLDIAFDPDDPSCIRSWLDEVHYIYRLRVLNNSGSVVHNVAITVEDICPAKDDFLGTKITLRHKPGVSSVSLKPNEKEYFDIVEYNSSSRTTNVPLLYLLHTTPHLDPNLPICDHGFKVRAYGDEANSVLVKMIFKYTSPVNCRFRQEVDDSGGEPQVVK